MGINTPKAGEMQVTRVIHRINNTYYYYWFLFILYFNKSDGGTYHEDNMLEGKPS